VLPNTNTSRQVQKLTSETRCGVKGASSLVVCQAEKKRDVLDWNVQCLEAASGKMIEFCGATKTGEGEFRPADNKKARMEREHDGRLGGK
jgi:hypothetical protein